MFTFNPSRKQAHNDKERELEKVNAFYLLKEAEVCVFIVA